MKSHRDCSKGFFLVYLQLAMKKHKDCTVPAQNCSQFPLTFSEGQQITSHFRFKVNANCYVHNALCHSCYCYSIHVLSSHDAKV